MTTTDYAAALTPTDRSPAIPARMHAQPHYEIEAQHTDDTAALSAARRVVAVLDGPAPADAPDSTTLTVRSVEALASVYGLLADAEEGLAFFTDRDGAEWAVGPHMDHKGLVAWNVWDTISTPTPLRELVADHGPLTLDETSVIQFDGIGHVDPAAEAAARIMSLLRLHGIHATAVAHGDRISVWNPIAATTDEWNNHVLVILRESYGLLASADNVDGTVELDFTALTPAPPAAAPDAWIAVRRSRSPWAEGPEWDRDAVVLPADDADEIAYRVGLGDEMLALYAEGRGTRGAQEVTR